MKTIGRITDSSGHQGYEGGTIIILTRKESQALQDLVDVCRGETYRHYWQSEERALIAHEEIALEAIFNVLRQFADVKRVANQFNMVFDEFEKLVGGIE